MNSTRRHPGARAIEEVSLRATRKFWSFVDEVPRFWKPTADPQTTDGDWLRIWAVEDDGRLTRVPAESVHGAGKRVAKDSYVYSASRWIAQFKPAAAIVAMECWGCTIDPALRPRLLEQEGGTPDLMVAENRQRLQERYGAEIHQSLIVQGELRSLADAVFRFHRIVGDTVGPALPSDHYRGFVSRYVGMLDPGGWAEPEGDFR